MQNIITKYFKKIKYFLLNKIPRKREKQYIFISHILTQTGAPFVLIDIIEEFAKYTNNKNIVVYVQNINDNNYKKLQKMSVTIRKYSEFINFLEFDYELNIQKDDFVFFNTKYIGDMIRERFFYYLDQNKLNKIHWYIHEDFPEMHFNNKNLVSRIDRYLLSKKLEIFVPGKKIMKNYEHHFQTKIHLLPYKLRLDNKYKKTLSINDYNHINFAINGTAHDGRKGQVIILQCFILFFNNYYKNNPDKYRNFSLNFIGLDNSFMSQTIIKLGQSFIEKHFVVHKRLVREEALKEMYKCNAIILYSFMEALPLSIFEGMYMGHFLLRNNCSGFEEQLQKNQNGFEIDSDNFQQFVLLIEQILNKEKTSNQMLLDMGNKSFEIYNTHKNQANQLFDKFVKRIINNT